MPADPERRLTIAQGFDRAAPGYDAARRKLVPCFDKFYGWAVRLLPFSSADPIRVLDLGAGTGLLSARILDAFPKARLRLVDLSGPMLDRAGERFAAIARENRPKCVHPRPIAILRSVDKNQMLVLALANVPTIITVLIGILLNNGRINDLNSRFSSMETRFTGLERKFENLDHKFDTRFDLLLNKVIDADNRLTRIEAQRH